MTTIDFSTIGMHARTSAQQLIHASAQDKIDALHAIARALDIRRQDILSANAKDIAHAQAQQHPSAFIDRLTLTPERIQNMIDGIKQIAALPDPIGEITHLRTNTSGLQVGRMRVPLGVIGIIYESRPNVTIDAAALCLKSSNAVILRGGSESIHSNRALMDAISAGLTKSALPQHCVQIIPDADRAWVSAMLQAQQYIDVIIPRGGKGLVKLISEQATMPVIKHLDGICHLYIDCDANQDIALRCADNGKTYRYGICGATETLLVHKQIADTFLPAIAEIYQRKGVEMRGCQLTQSIISTYDITAADESDWHSEYLAPIISIKVVSDYEQALTHIAQYGSHHTDAIVTENIHTAQRFLREVDSASVMVNTPTCFADGYEYGLGAEIGISTDKIHWRGPVGIEGLTSQKFVIISHGLTR